jgi:hypothetical protein
LKYDRRVIVSARIFEPSPELLAKLRIVRERWGDDDITRAYEAFSLDGGLGPPTYLSTDGRIVWDDDVWGVIGTRGEAFAAVVAGAQKTGVPELRDLLPARESPASDCADCHATGRFDFDSELKDTENRPFSIVCPQCAGLGWTAPSVMLTESVLEAG